MHHEKAILVCCNADWGHCCRYGRLAKIPISFNRAIVNFMSAIRLCPAGVKDVHDMLVRKLYACWLCSFLRSSSCCRCMRQGLTGLYIQGCWQFCATNLLSCLDDLSCSNAFTHFAFKQCTVLNDLKHVLVLRALVWCAADQSGHKLVCWRRDRHLHSHASVGLL